MHRGADPDQVAQALRGGGYHVVEAKNAEEAWLQLESFEPELLVDLESGIPASELIERVRGDSRTAGTAILSIADDDRRRPPWSGLAHGADTYLERPVSEREVIAQVDALLRVRRAEQQARRLAREWKIAFDAITDAIIVLSGDGTVVRCNEGAARILGRPPSMVVGSEYAQLWPHDTRNLPELAVINQAVVPFSCEVGAKGRWYRLAVAPIAEPHNPAAGDAVLVLTDITDNKQLEAQLRERAAELQRHNERQREFLGLLAHELRNPLAAAAAATDVLGDRSAPEHRLRDARSVLERQMANLERIVSDLLDVGRIREGKVALRRSPLDLREVVESAAAAVRDAAERAHHHLQVCSVSEPLFANMDPTRIEQVLTNLLDNAVKYTPPGGRIAIALARDEHEPETWARIEVRDTGPGLPAGSSGEAFEMFVQFERTLERSQGGLGLGLMLVKRLVELHGGTVHAHSDGPDQGARFTVRLPLCDPPQKQAKSDGESAATGPARRVLLVEDNDDFRQLLAWRLRRAGHEVFEASTGPEGLDWAKAHAPDCLVLDVGLPGMDGYQLAHELRNTHSTQHCRLVALTGYGSQVDQRKAAEAGFDAHLVKPVKLERLLEQIAQGPLADDSPGNA